MTRILYLPALPRGCEVNVSTWRCPGWQGGARTWDVDAALAAGPLSASEFTPTMLDARDPIPREAVVRLAATLAKSTDPKTIRAAQLIRADLDGHRLAEPGSRRGTIRDLTWRLAQAFPTGSAAGMLDYFRLSLQFMIAEGVDASPFDQFTKLLEDAQRKIHETGERKRLERASDRRPTITLGGRLEDMADRSIEALGPLDLFQRSGRSVT